MREKVIVVGAGVGGLTAAHELVERGFDVHVYERRSFAGGKAASVRIERRGDGEQGTGLPGEHGFRFFPSWYRHLPDTLRKIPFRGRRTFYEGASVYDNLVPADVNLLAWYDRDPTPLPMHLPRNASQFRALADFAMGLKQFGLSAAEARFFFGKLAAFLSTPEEQRVERFQNLTWWEYVEASSKSVAYQNLISATTRTMVAAKATEACAYTIGKLALRTLFDSVADVDRVLNGPTNEVWIEPWIEHLMNRGVTFHFGQELESIEFNDREPRVHSLVFSSRLASDLGRLRALLEPLAVDLEAVDNGSAESTSDNGPALSGAAASGAQRTLSGAALRARHARVNAMAGNLRSLVASLKRELNELHDPSERGSRSPSRERVGTTLPAEAVKRALTELDAIEKVFVPIEEAGLGTYCAVVPSKDPVGDIAGQADEAFKRDDEYEAFDRAPRYSDGLARYAFRAGANFERDKRKRKDPRFWTTAGVQRRGSAIRQIERLLSPPVAEAQYFVFALPVEQMAYYVNRSATLRLHAPELAKVVPLSDATDWMAGIQFYLREPIHLTPGHVVSMDSEWGLTALEQTQFWRDIAVPSDVKSIISVDIAAWDRRGRNVRKEAYNCTDNEIAEEVWAQLKAALNRSTRQPLLDDRMLARPKGERAHPVLLIKSVNYHVDDSIVDVFDRKKQGAYERARGVRFSVVEPSAASGATGAPALTTPYVWGPRLRYNAEPLLVNRVGTHRLRPQAKTRIANLFLAADYVKTETDLACMEGANEAARHATNALLDAAGSNAQRCQTWSFMGASHWTENLLNAVSLSQDSTSAAVLKGANAVADGALGMVGQAASMLKGFWEKK